MASRLVQGSVVRRVGEREQAVEARQAPGSGQIHSDAAEARERERGAIERCGEVVRPGERPGADTGDRAGEGLEAAALGTASLAVDQLREARRRRAGQRAAVAAAEA